MDKNFKWDVKINDRIWQPNLNNYLISATRSVSPRPRVVVDPDYLKDQRSISLELSSVDFSPWKLSFSFLFIPEKQQQENAEIALAANVLLFFFKRPRMPGKRQQTSLTCRMNNSAHHFPEVKGLLAGSGSTFSPGWFRISPEPGRSSMDTDIFTIPDQNRDKVLIPHRFPPISESITSSSMCSVMCSVFHLCLVASCYSYSSPIIRLFFSRVVCLKCFPTADILLPARSTTPHYCGSPIYTLPRRSNEAIDKAKWR